MMKLTENNQTENTETIGSIQIPSLSFLPGPL